MPPDPAPPDNTPRRPRRLPLKPFLFLLALASLSAAKHWHNAAQMAHEVALPQRIRAHADRYQRMRDAYEPIIADHVGSDIDTLRQAIDPDGKANAYRNWSAESHGEHSTFHTFRDPVNDRTLTMHLTRGGLKSAWIGESAFVNATLPGWAAGERARKSAAILAALAWAAAAFGAYREPLLRRKLGLWALACALVACAAWSLEPPELIRGAGFRVPFGPYVGAALVLLTLPALLRDPRHSARGHCHHCNYDLTGNQSGVCPECGQPTPAEARRRRQQSAAAYATALEIPTPPDDPPAPKPAA